MILRLRNNFSVLRFFFFLALFENPSDLTASLTNILKVPFFFTIIFEFFALIAISWSQGLKVKIVIHWCLKFHVEYNRKKGVALARNGS